uniref:Store-operated calcium entry-associated regulatory factor n=1 Tax=Aceria tosichella TaxID=561515 RepID=A0A6G1SEK8_9ACAR
MFTSQTISTSRPLPLVGILVILTAALLLCMSRPSMATDSDEDESDRLFHEGAIHEEDNGHHHNSQHHAKSTTHNPNLPLPKDKLLLSDVKTLTFIRNKRTTSRRTHSIHQLSCVGGTAGCKLFTPNVVECHNTGTNDKTTGKPKWRCQADMSDRVQFNHVEVICEGYDYPEDDYILMGSCGLEFTLDYVNPHDYHDQSYFKHMDQHEKDLHHERVRGQNKPTPKANKPSVIIEWLHTQITDHSLVLIVFVVLLVVLALIKSGLYSGSGAAAANTSSSVRAKKPLGGVGSKYGPLTSAVMTTKKAC